MTKNDVQQVLATIVVGRRLLHYIENAAMTIFSFAKAGSQDIGVEHRANFHIACRWVMRSREGDKQLSSGDWRSLKPLWTAWQCGMDGARAGLYPTPVERLLREVCSSVVSDVEISDDNDLTIRFASGQTIVVSLDPENDDEQWRFLDGDKPGHIVCSNTGSYSI